MKCKGLGLAPQPGSAICVHSEKKKKKQNSACGAHKKTPKNPSSYQYRTLILKYMTQSQIHTGCASDDVVSFSSV